MPVAAARVDLMRTRRIAVTRGINKRGSLVTHVKGAGKYVQQGISTWIHGWKQRGWKTAAKQPVKNEDLWRRLDEAVSRHKIEWVWVKGHAGHTENERADQLANRGVEDILSGKIK